MGIFDPKVDANIAPTQAVQGGPSGVQVLGNLLGGAINAYSAGAQVAAGPAPSASQRRDEMQNAQLVGLSDSLLKAEALRRDGREAEADRAEQAVLANAARGGVDLSDGQVKALYRATTGRDPQFMGVSEEERISEAVMETPDYQNAFIASYSSGNEMTPEERKNFALAQVARNQGHALMINNNNIAWHEGRQEAFSGAIATFRGTTLGALQIAAQEGRMVPLATINQAEVAWSAQREALVSMRPNGISDSDWKSVKDQMEAVDQSFAVLRKVSGSEAIDAQLAQAFSASVMAMEAPNAEKMQLLTIIKDPAQLREFGVISNTRMKELLEATTVSDFDMGSFGTLSDPAINSGEEADGSPKLFPSSVLQDIQGQDAGKLLQEAKDISLANRMGNNADILSNPNKRDAFTKTASKAFAAMSTISKDNGEFVSGNTINEVFDGTMIAGIDTVAQSSPSVARTLYRQGEETLNQQDAVATQAMLQVIRRSRHFGFENGKVVMDIEALDNFGFADDIKMGFRDTADQYYGGDLAAMFADRGRLVDPRNPETKQFRNLLRGGMVAGLMSQVDEMNSMAATVNSIRQKRNEFRARAEGLMPEERAVSAEDAELIAAQSLQSLDASKIRGFDKIAQDKSFLNAVDVTSKNLGINPTDLLAAMSFETVGTFSPSIKNPNGSATGLIQFLEKTANGLGTSTAALSQMSREQQMEYVERYLRPYKGRMNNLGDVYMAIHWPKGVGQDDDYVMYRSGSAAYNSNKNLDSNGDGTVTRGETLSRLNSVFKGGSGIRVSSLSGEALPNGSGLSATQGGSSVPQTGSAVQVSDLVPTAPVSTGAESGGVPGVGANTEVVDTIDENVNSTGGSTNGSSSEPSSSSVSRELDAAAISKLVDARLTPEQKRQIRIAGFRPEETLYFKDQKEAEAALEAGEVDRGTLYVTETGNVFLLE